MYIKNPYITFTYRLLLLTICGIGIFRHFSFGNFDSNVKMFSYFTIQMNIFCFFLYFFILKNTFKEFQVSSGIAFNLRNKYKLLRGMALASIIIVFLAYNFVLKNSGFSMAKGCPTTVTTNDIFVHYLVPIMTVIDWFLFQPKGHFEAIDPFIWLFLPVCYYCLINVKTVFKASSYPYYFIDINELGLRTVLYNAFIFMLICLFLGYIILLIDKILSKNFI